MVSDGVALDFAETKWARSSGVEHYTHIVGVDGSSPSVPTILVFRRLAVLLFCASLLYHARSTAKGKVRTPSVFVKRTAPQRAGTSSPFGSIWGFLRSSGAHRVQQINKYSTQSRSLVKNGIRYNSVFSKRGIRPMGRSVKKRRNHRVNKTSLLLT